VEGLSAPSDVGLNSHAGALRNFTGLTANCWLWVAAPGTACSQRSLSAHEQEYGCVCMCCMARHVASSLADVGRRMWQSFSWGLFDRSQFKRRK
jgi:hypothetical protein